MGLFDFLKTKKRVPDQKPTGTNHTMAVGNVKGSATGQEFAIADSSSISPDERPFYQPDEYYTMYSYPGTGMSRRVVPFEERKRISYPSANGLYVAEILLLQYCSYGDYPKPRRIYPGLWWFQYGIRDVGHALESLYRRGFLQWGTQADALKHLRVEELKEILTAAGLPATGKKADLIDRIITEVPEDRITVRNYTRKYALTEKGKRELQDNGYVPYMHKHRYTTTEDGLFGETFNVWDINRLFPDGKASDWRRVVGQIEKERFGIDMAGHSEEGDL